MSNWFWYLKRALDKEKYELAAKIRDVISLEMSEFYKYLSKFCSEFNEEQDLYYVQFVEEELKKEFGI